MGTIVKTQRSYNEFYTGEKFDMYQNSETHELFLISEKTGEKVKGFLYSAFNNISYRFYDKSEINLKVGQFFILEKNNPPIAKKFTGLQKRFVKI